MLFAYRITPLPKQRRDTARGFGRKLVLLTAFALAGVGETAQTAALTASSTAESSSASSGEHMWRRTDIGAIPTWKLDMRYDPSRLIQPQKPHQGLELPDGAFYLPLDAGAGGSVVGYASGNDALGMSYLPGSASSSASQGNAGRPPAYGSDSSSANGAPVVGIGSTQGQDSGKCPLISLDNFMFIQAKNSNNFFSIGQEGLWTTANRIVLSAWSQNFWSRQWMGFYLRSYTDKLAVKVVPISEQELQQAYGWKAKAENYPNFPAPYGAPMNWSQGERQLTLAMTDCDNNLMFVVHLQKAHPGAMDIYDRLGNLAAHAITDPLVARFQFVDPNGYLLAMAESPGLLMNVTRAEAPLPGRKGEILPYAMKFMSGGYPNASRLMDLEYRWVLAAAVQARALTDAYGGWQPWTAASTLVLAWAAVVFYVVLLLWATTCLYQVVYPEADGKFSSNPFLHYSQPEKRRLIIPGQSMYTY